MGLNTESVVAEAIALVDTDGFATLSLSALAQRLGVRVPSLYKHIEGIDDLRQRISEIAKAELWDVVNDAARDRHGLEAFRAIAIAYRDYAIRYPGRFDAAGYNARLNPAPIAVGSLERVAQECGIPAEHSGRIVQALRASLRGLLTLQVDTTADASGAVYASLLDLLEAGLLHFESSATPA
jgi:AcrR family transcriptional regulator